MGGFDERGQVDSIARNFRTIQTNIRFRRPWSHWTQYNARIRLTRPIAVCLIRSVKEEVEATWRDSLMKRSAFCVRELGENFSSRPLRAGFSNNAATVVNPGIIIVAVDIEDTGKANGRATFVTNRCSRAKGFHYACKSINARIPVLVVSCLTMPLNS